MILNPIKGLTKGSHYKCNVQCDFQLSENCVKQYKNLYKDVYRYRLNNNGKDICLYCSRKLKSTGRINPNCRYKNINDAYFKNIDTKEKAYILGWIASDGTIRKSGFGISIKNIDFATLEVIKNCIDSNLVIKNRPHDMITLTVSSQQISQDLCTHLKIKPGKKSSIVRMPNLSDDLGWYFLRGYFEGDGCVNKPQSFMRPKCDIISNSQNMLLDIKNFTKSVCSVGKSGIYWSGNNALDFMGKLYKNADNENLKLYRKYDRYCGWCKWVPSIRWSKNIKQISKECINFKRSDKRAIAPSKERISDSGYDISIIDIDKKIGNTTFYKTGLKLQPPFGYYFDLVPRSSISKTGYILANSIGIIDRTYVGELIIPLMKIDENAPDLELPRKIAQIIPRQIVHFDIQEVDELTQSERQDKGFGSSGL